MTTKVKKRRHLLDEEMEEKGYVSAAEAARLLRRDQSWVHELCDKDRLEHLRIGGQEDGHYARTYIKRESLRAYLGPEAAKLLKV